ncbi:TPA: transposase [Streptococcus pyogenes]|uniref:transposase n=1 Tax=Streptococcus pyogenes TaxID=1314 RepID=UPI00109BB974|nr:transposase [Streptococcus pyogenes]HEP6115039.1 transposase [Streptococcus pyogenes]HEQ2364999.1 transposase [Streptococcus pyogenes]HEQ4464577.1 transposase [Streptococcus pyogenes]HEQ8519285.1 transposase [Streptococcus pyogenes]
MLYIDETGIDTYLTRLRARALRGHKVLDKIRGRRFERISVLAGQIGNQFVAPMIYKDSMTSDFFMKWFSEQLLPSLSETHVIVMDNANFHPKKQIDELCVEQQHFFLPLPPYSRELNPIETAWANLKKAVTELLRQFESVNECLCYYFKT